MINPLNIKHKYNYTLLKIKSILPPKLLLPIFLSIFFDALAGSFGGGFFNIWLDKELQPSYVVMAVVLAIPGIIALFATTGFSIISDKNSRRKELLFMGRVALILQYIFLIFFNKSIWTILGILVSFSLFIQIYYIINNTIATIICPPNRKGEISSFLMLFSGAGYTLGSLFSGIVYERFYETYGLAINLSIAAGFVLLSCIAAMFSPSKTINGNIKNNNSLENDQKKNNEHSSTNVNDTLDVELKKEDSRVATFFEIFMRPQIIALLISIGILDFAIGPFSLLGSIYLNKIVGLSYDQIGYINSVSSVIGLITLLFIGKFIDRFGRKKFLLVPITIYPFYFLLFYLLRAFPIVISFLWILPIYPFRAPTTVAMMSDMTAENERARGMTLLQYESIFAYNFGAIIGGVLAEYTGLWLYVAPLFPSVIALFGIGFAYLTLKETNQISLEKKSL